MAKHKPWPDVASMIQEGSKPKGAKRQRYAAAAGPGLAGAIEDVQDLVRREGEANGGAALTNKRRRKLRQIVLGEGAQPALLAGGREVGVAQQAEQRASHAHAAGEKPRCDPPWIKQAEALLLCRLLLTYTSRRKAAPGVQTVGRRGAARGVIHCVAGCAWFGY